MIIIVLLNLLSMTVEGIAIAVAGGVLAVVWCPIMTCRMMVVVAGHLVLVMVRGRDGGGRRRGRIGWWRVVVDDDDLQRRSVLVELCPVCWPLPRTRGGHSCAARVFFLLRTMVVWDGGKNKRRSFFFFFFFPCRFFSQGSRGGPLKGGRAVAALCCFLPVFLPLVLSLDGKQSGMGPVCCSSGKKGKNEIQ